MRHLIAFCLTILPHLLAGAANAHPHIFVDTKFEVVVNGDNELTHIRVSWSYDDLYSLLLAEDFEIDQDGDGQLTAKETALLTGFDMQWIPGYDGDLDVALGGRKLNLSQPMDYTATMQDGVITTTHLRAVSGTPKLSKVLALKPYDATFYTAYDVSAPATITGAAGCSQQTVQPDIDDALAQLQQQLSTLDPNADLEGEGFPKMGEKFASTLEITCPAL